MPPNRCRAGAACEHCNRRKSKCDAQQNGIPCSACRHRGLADCRILPTARGKYIRKNKKAPSVDDPLWRPSFTADIPEQEDLGPPAQTPISIPPYTAPAPGPASQPGPSEEPILDDHDLPAPELHVPGESSWVDLFRTFLKHRGADAAIDKACITYLGESFPLATVLEDLQHGNMLQLYHPGPYYPDHSPTSDEGLHPPNLDKTDVAFLNRKRVFDLPPDHCFKSFISTFIDKVYPLYPAVILRDFIQQCENQCLPWILCHAVCFVAANFCPLHTIHSAGYRTRREALDAFYTKTKLLFDFSYERNKIILLQTAILLTFWPSSPNDVWTFYHWIGFGVTLAESLGIHRTCGYVNMEQKDRSLLKRLWWILVIRDAFGAALFGRPVRIDGGNCDVAHVVESDFGWDFDTGNDPVFGLPLHTQYFPQAARLAVILRDITNNRFQPSTTQAQITQRSATQLRLDDWRAGVPEDLDWDTESASRNIFTATLSILYNNNVIFMNLQKPSSTCSPHSQDEHATFISSPRTVTILSESTQEAAERIINLAGDMVLFSGLNSMPHEVFTGLFMAEAVSYARVSSTDPNTSKLARAQINSCQMIFHEVRDFWDPASWVMQLFNSLLSKGDNHSKQKGQLDSAMFVDDFMGHDFLKDLDNFLGDMYFPIL